MSALDESQQLAIPLAVGSVAVAVGLVLFVQALGLLPGPAGLPTRAAYGVGGMFLIGFGWLFLTRALIDLVRTASQTGAGA